LSSVTDTNQIQLLLKTLRNTCHHIGDQCTNSTRKRTSIDGTWNRLTEKAFTFFFNGYCRISLDR